MSRNRIPQVRAWRVRYHLSDNTTRDCVVRTINKRFARWEANDIMRGKVSYWSEPSITKITISLAREATS